MQFAPRSKNVVTPLVWLILLVGFLAACSTTEVAPGASDSEVEVYDVTPTNDGPRFRLNAGGEEVTLDGVLWEADAYHSDSGTRDRLVAIGGTDDDVLYRTFRESNAYAGSFRYDIHLATQGRYRVKLHFAELFHDAAGKRVFDVDIEGDTMLDNFDIHALVGATTAHVEAFEVEVTDEVLSIDFRAYRGRPIVNAVEIELLEELGLGGEPVVKLNAGGEAYTFEDTSWAADAFFGGSAVRERPVAVAGTDMDALYRTFRESNSRAGNFTYDIPLAVDGSYLVTLHFAELYHAESGKRVFDVDAEGVEALKHFDIFAEAGYQTAIAKRFQVDVEDGVLNLYFQAYRGRPIVNAIEVDLLEARPSSGGSDDGGGSAGGADEGAYEGGSDGKGPVPGPLPANGVWVEPGTDIQKLIDSKPAGTTYILAKGVHRLQSFSPNPGDTIVGEYGAVLSGAVVLDNWTREGDLWVAANQTQTGLVVSQTTYNGSPLCTDTASNTTVSPRCHYPHDLFLDDVVLPHVTSKSAVQPGTWYFDYGADKIYMADDPRGRKVETSITEQAIYGNGSSNVTLRNLVVEKYASPANTPAINGAGNWTVANLDVRLNHAIGIRLGGGTTLRDSYLHHNGQAGVTAQGRDLLVENNEIAYNNELGFNTNWAGGGTKFTKTQGAVIRSNNVHSNFGPGLWFDHENIYMTAENNRAADNAGPGILIEVSYDTVLRNNIIEGNGYGRTQWVLGAGIFVNMSPNIDIIGNTVRGNYHGVMLVQGKRDFGDGKYGPHELDNIEVRDNLITMERGQTGMVVQGNIADPEYYFSKDIVFEGNDYRLGDQSKPFKWDGSRTVQGWKSVGHDLGGSFN